MTIISRRSTALRMAKHTWTQCYGHMRRLDPQIQVRPKDAESIFTVDDSDNNRVRLNIKPVVLCDPAP